MAETLSNGSLQQTHNLKPLFYTVDPMSLLLSQTSSAAADQPISPLSLTAELCFDMERGPRYGAYAELRERKLRMKHMRQQEEPDPVQTPPRKQVKFQGSSVNGRKVPSFLAQSVPDFSSMMRKENQKPINNVLSPLIEMTPPTKKFTKGSIGTSVGSSARGSKSATAGEKKGGGMMVRKSYACVQELKGFSSMAATNSIGGDRIGTRNSNRGTTRRSVLGSRQYYI